MNGFFTDNKRIKAFVIGCVSILSSFGFKWAADIDVELITTGIITVGGMYAAYAGGQSWSDAHGKGKVEAEAKAAVQAAIMSPTQVKAPEL